MTETNLPDYPFCLPSYVAAFDDGQLAQQELKAETRSWRSEGYAKESDVLIFDHHHGAGIRRRCNDDDINRILAEPPPKVRFILLLPTVHEKIADTVARNPAAAKVLRKNELYDEHAGDPADPEKASAWIGDQFNISRKSLFKIMTKYDIAPAACSHIRGQEQIFGSRARKNQENKITSFEFWYAIRARAYYREVDQDADLKMTIVTKYDVASDTTVVLLKYRSFNDLPCRLKRELISKVHELVMQPTTESIVSNPFAITLFHFNSTAQWYRRAARDPRDSVRNEEEKAHDQAKGNKNEVNAINVRRLHLTMRNLDQDKLQLTFILGVIDRLRKQHDLFYKLVERVPVPEDRDWLYLRVDEEFDRLENQITYFRSSIEDVSNRAQRLLDLLFNLSGQQNARWSEKVGLQAMHESASMRAIAIVSMLFLPGTFVCGILGTNLFSAEESGSGGDPGTPFKVSSRWWILLVTMIPLTGLTFLIWFVWRSRTESQVTKKIAEEDFQREEFQKDVESGKGSKKRRRSLAALAAFR
ncbi:hypothetical protein K469DRAFT_683656 [Zopfia rhizophila CBS 207.26]|uniref:Cora-domain-containing protein n=1 Tax=Zopfia rhizophila CBS 207.26 TaxID=1314779 RepID=A0A6A6EF66_9PEZI|nr:hypothetical protein K469DRAFT_683656 [Zopfia rhizophila CBS 207.26]